MIQHLPQDVVNAENGVTAGKFYEINGEKLMEDG
jgi:hypothetical protein